MVLNYILVGCPWSILIEWLSYFIFFFDSPCCFSILYRCKTYRNYFYKQSFDRALRQSTKGAQTYALSAIKPVCCERYANRSLFRLLVQTTFWNTGGEQISRFIEQANNHHASILVKFTEQISKNKILFIFQNIIVAQRGKLLKHVNSRI